MNKLRQSVTLLLGLVCAGFVSAETVVRHDVELSLSPATGAIEIVDRVRPGAGHEYRFALAPWLALHDLRINDKPAVYSRAGNRYRIALPSGADPEIRFELGGSIPAPQAGDLSRSGIDGVYLPGYAGWLPVGAADRIDFSLKVRVPGGMRAVATGRLIEAQSSGEAYRATFESHWPGEPPSLFAGPYEVNQSQGSTPAVQTYFHPELDPLSEAYLEAAAAYLARYDTLIGTYPYDDFRIVSAPLPVGLGFPGLTYVGREVLPLPFMRKRSLAHEVLHNWWGNGVAVDYADGNWAEGLTTYLADYALAEDDGNEPARTMRLKWLRDYSALPPSRDRPLTEFIGKQHDAAQVIGYNKAAFVFHMLRREIGETAFIDGLRLFWQRHRQRSAGWGDLRRAFEESSGVALGWFFEQWLERPGAPLLSLGAHRVEQTAQGYRVELEVLQKAPAYRLKLPLRLVTRDGVETRSVTVDTVVNRLEFDLAEKPAAIHIDPDSEIFRRLTAAETPPILRDVTLDPETLTVIAGSDAAFRDPARELAGRLLDTPPRFAGAEAVREQDRPLLLIADSEQFDQLRRELELETAPQRMSARQTAAAWVLRRANGSTVLVVTARDAGALRQLLRPLPHYASQSYVLFEGRRAADKGIWPVLRGPLYRELDAALRQP